MTHHNAEKKRQDSASAPASVSRLSAIAGGACGLVLALLVFLLLGYFKSGPGQDLAKQGPKQATELSAPDEAKLLALQQATNEGLRQEIARLREVLQGDVCIQPDKPSALPLPPGGVGRVLPRQSANGSAPEIKPSGTSAPAERQSIGNLLAQATVFIFYKGPEGVASGTGFFVTPEMVVTNKHVVEESKDGLVYVTGAQLGGVVRARVEAVSSGEDRDYAVLRVEPSHGLQVTPLVFNEKIARTDHVSAWGYPGLLLQADPKFSALMEGDASASPEVIYTEGFVNVVHQYGSIPAVIHSADLSHGNSGGPLVNDKGQVVAINTLILLDKQSNRQTSISLGSMDLVRFLRENGISVAVAEKGGLMNSRRIITATSLVALRPLAYQAVQVSSCYAQLVTLLGNHLGSEEAAFLAEPESSPDAREVDWYTGSQGSIVKLLDLPPAEQEEQRSKIAGIARRMEDLSASLCAENNSNSVMAGSLLRLALQYPDEQSLYVVGTQPVLINWGFSRAADAAAPEPLTRLADAGIARAPVPPSSSVPSGGVRAGLHPDVIQRSRWRIPLWLVSFLLSFLLLLALLLFVPSSCSHVEQALPGGESQERIPPRHKSLFRQVRK